MFYKQQNDQEEVPSQKQYLNQDAETEQESKQASLNNQNYNYPQIQQPQQQLSNPQIINPITENPQQGNLYHQHPTIVAPDINENSLLSHTGQKRVFTLSIVILWIVQILIELSFLLKFVKTPNIWKLYTCFFIALIILIYTVWKNHPTNLKNNVSFMDKLLFIIYFLADVFTIIAIFDLQILTLNVIFFIFRLLQFGNLLCSMPTLVQANQIQMKGIIITTLTPLVFLLLYVCLVMSWNIFYLVPVSWQISQFILTFHFVRVINNIYNKKNQKIDINNIYTGFILFKYSYYIPF